MDDCCSPLVELSIDAARLASRAEVAAQADGDQPLRVTPSMDVTDDLQHLRRLALTLAVAAVVGASLFHWEACRSFTMGSRQCAGWRLKCNPCPQTTFTNATGQFSSALELAPLVEQFNGLLGRLDQAYIQLEGFNADVAHELCTPLATLLASNELAHCAARKVSISPEVLSSNLEEIHRLTGIVNDMLFLSQADRGVVARRTFTPSLAAVVERVVEYHEAALSEAGLELRISGDVAGSFDVPLSKAGVVESDW